MGIGTSSCAKFQEAYAATPKSAEAKYFSWAQGFMSGLNSGQILADKPYRDLSSIDPHEQFAMTRSYCDQHPREEYLVAVLNLMKHLEEKPSSP